MAKTVCHLGRGGAADARPRLPTLPGGRWSRILCALGLAVLLVGLYRTSGAVYAADGSVGPEGGGSLTRTTQARGALLLNTDALVLDAESGSTTLTALLRSARGEPVPATAVYFESEGGALSRESGTTGADGVVTSTFTAGATGGQAIITARATGLTATVALQIRAPAQDRTGRQLELAAGADVVPGGATVPVTATLKDLNGEPIAGALVSFFGALGQVSPASALTDAAGQATVGFTAGGLPGRARLSALADYTSAMIVLQVSAPSGPGDHWVYLPLLLK